MSYIHEALKKAEAHKDKALLINTLYLSIRKVKAQRGTTIEVAKVDKLIAAAQAVIDDLQLAQKNSTIMPRRTGLRRC